MPSVNGYARSRMCVLASRSTGNRLRFTARLPEGIPKNEVTLGDPPPTERGGVPRQGRQVEREVAVLAAVAGRQASQVVPTLVAARHPES